MKNKYPRNPIFFFKKKISPDALQRRSKPPGLFELVQQSVVFAQGEVQCPRLVIVGIKMQVLDDVGQQVGAVHTAARRLVAQLGEVKVQVVVRRLVVQVGPQFAGRKVVLLKDDFLKHRERQEMLVKTLETSERSKSLVTNSPSIIIITKPHLSFLEDVLQQRQMV